MGERQFEIDSADKGAQVLRSDMNTWSENAAIADDRVLWELLRTKHGATPPTKGIMAPGNEAYEADGISGYGTTIVVGAGATGKVRVRPIRVVVGSRTAVGAGTEKASLRDARTGYLVGSTVRYSEVTITANASGNPRWDLVYATISPDADEAAAPRNKKDPATLTVTTPSIVAYKATTVTVSALAGTPAATPSLPATPADSASAFNVPLAYVWVPNGHGAASTVARFQIHEIAKILRMHEAVGPSAFTASGNYASAGAVETRQGSGAGANNNWSTTDWPGGYCPPEFGSSVRAVAHLQVDNALSGASPKSHAAGDVIDDTIDWRGRIFLCRVVSGAASRVPWDPATGADPYGGFLRANGTYRIAHRVGQSLRNDGASALFGSPANYGGCACLLAFGETDVYGLATDAYVAVYVDSSTGALKYGFGGTAANCTGEFVFFIEATGQRPTY